MAAKKRVHELAKELGMTNKETLDLCVALGIGVKTHSSSIEDAQADRVRRKAEREGLIRDVQPEEPAKGAKGTKKGAETAPELAAAPLADAPAPARPEAPAPVPPRPDPIEAVPAPAPPAPAPAPPARLVTSSGSGRPAPPRRVDEEPARPAAAAPRPDATPVGPGPAARPAPAAQAPAAQAPAAQAPAAQAPAAQAPAAQAPAPQAPAAERPSGPVEPAPAPTAEPAPAAPSAPPRPVAPAASAAPSEAAPGADPSTSGSNGDGPPLRSGSGKPIPPPPGMGGRGPVPPRGAPGRGAPAAPGRRVGGPPSGAPTGGRPAGPGGNFGPNRPPGGGGPGGGPGGGRPGGGGRGPQRPPRRKGGRRRRSREELQPMDLPTYTPKEAPVPEGDIVLERSSSPQELGPRLNRTAADVVRFLMQLGEMVTATQSLSDEQIELFAEEIGVTIRLVDPGEEQEVELQKVLGVEELLEDDEEHAVARPPIITVMGHVDHGKTKLLDKIRDANVVAGEAGGITQAIGAYQAEKNSRLITFIDTPGHEAFTAMRARGAEATDIVILVVAADDGVMPQTIEALNHAKASGAPIVVAINKIDREQAQPDRVKQQLSEHGLIPQEWGGDTEMIPVSALTGDGVDDLLETILLVADVEDLKANPAGRAAGVVLESHLDIGRGPVANLLVQRGTIRVGEPLVAGPAWGRVRALINHLGEPIKEAGPSMPVQVLGLNDVADAGDSFVVAPDEKTARSVAEKREHWHRVANLGREAAAPAGARLEDIFEQIQRGDVATLNILLKADTTGSLEALTESLRKLERDEVKLAFVHRAVGGITQQDVQLAATSGATIIGFNVRPDRKARELAQGESVEVRTYEIIYQALEDIENAMVGMLAPEFEEVVTGEAEVREIFSVPRIGKIAGCMVLNGTITRGSRVRFLRDGTVIWKGAVNSLRRFKDDVREVQAGFECGIGLTDFQDLKQGDIIETFEEREIPRT
ncbi:MAG: translation initiation factor IF-2 [Acidimicrobiales bacterium]